MFSLRRITGFLFLAVGLALPGAAVAKPGQHHVRGAATAATFSFGQPNAGAVGATGCGTNVDGEPAIHVSRANDVFLGSERGVGSGSDLWRALNGLGGPGAGACSQAEYRGQPSAFGGVGASGGDIDVAIAPQVNALGNFKIYVAS